MRRPDGAIRAARRSWLLNGVLGLALVVVAAGTWVTVRSSAPSATVASRTATVSRGSLAATVSGTGNLASSRSSALSFGASGTVTKVYVAVGDTVDAGDLLATIDTGSATRSLDSAKAQLTSAQAAYHELVAGRTSAQRTSDALQIKAAQLSVDNATTSLAQARRQLAQDTTTQNALVDRAVAALEGGSGTQAAVNAAKSTRSQTLTKDRQSVTSAEQQLASARVQLAQQRATVAQNAQGATAADLAQARVTIQTAQAAVSDARDALDATRLTAPFAGTVLTVAGAAGDDVTAGSTSSGTSSGSGSTGSTGSTGTTASTGTTGGTTGTGTTSSTGSTGTTSGSSSAFVTMASLSSMEVTAQIAEADIGDVKTGQEATVTLPASGDTATGTVTAVSPEGTTSNNVVQYPVTVTIADPPGSARLGASASVSITTGSASDALVLATSAITTTGNRSTVQLLKNGVATTTPVELGLEGSSSTQVTSGLAAGDVVRIPSGTTSSGSAGFGIPGGGLGGPGLGGAR